MLDTHMKLDGHDLWVRKNEEERIQSPKLKGIKANILFCISELKENITVILKIKQNVTVF